MSAFRRVAALAASLLLAPAAQASGPVPEYEPVGTIVAHRRLAELAPDVVTALQDILGPRFVIETHDPCGDEPGVACEAWPKDGMMVWARDYHPLPVRQRDGRLKLVSYISPNPNRTLFPEVARSRGQGPLQALLGPASLEPPPAPPSTTLERMPVLFEGGNLVTDGQRVYMTDLVHTGNVQPPERADLVATGFRDRAPNEISRLVANALEVAPADLRILPPMPGDQTRHVDMFLMAVGPGQLVVPRIAPEELVGAPEGISRTLAGQVASFLDQIAVQVQADGVQVERLPMAGPLLFPVMGRPGVAQAVYLSPTNSLLLNTERGRRVLLPTARGVPGDPAAEKRRRGYEKIWAEWFQARGWTPRIVDVGSLLERGGLIHCATAHLPAVTMRGGAQGPTMVARRAKANR